ncbi:MAG: GrpB family protein [bacterium]|nr:GrpB family protein [bacterium]
MIKTIGLKRGTVKIVPYSTKWHTAFEKEKKVLSNILKGKFLDIQHIGSTSIPGLVAKPILDIAIAISNINILEECIKKLENNGYQYLGDKEGRKNYLFVKGDEDNRTHYIHIVGINSLNWKNYILFRDYLISNKDSYIEYSKLKKKLAKRFSNNRKEYTKLKADFIEKIIDEARQSQEKLRIRKGKSKRNEEKNKN